MPDESNQGSEPKDPTTGKRQRRSPNWGGRREGAGRKPNEEPTLWMQVGVVLTPEELSYVRDPHLTPAQRRHRLLTERGTLPDWYTEEPPAGEKRKQYNLRVVLEDWSERQEILALKTGERRRRILSVPPGGDIEDLRKGRWYADDSHKSAQPPEDDTTAHPAQGQ
jgi:hypothetical protein